MAGKVTTNAEFHFIPTDEKHLFKIAEGVSAMFALSVAELAGDFVHRYLQEAMANNTTGINVEIHYDDVMVLDLLMQMAASLRTAAGATA
ncbi:hypothetical protein ACIPR8_11175 [Stenotrophomonas sp. LARHCG68]